MDANKVFIRLWKVIAADLNKKAMRNNSKCPLGVMNAVISLESDASGTCQ